MPCPCARWTSRWTTPLKAAGFLTRDSRETTGNFFIDEDVIVGYNEKIAKRLEAKIIECSINGCIDAEEILSCSDPTHTHTNLNNSVVDVPIFGPVDSKELSLPLFTFIRIGISLKSGMRLTQ